ncbi:hypothetical protein [Stutzerimonas stutzeri]|uniref:hypothetical protein n=1 Tax=Stutzerimonas stutzeri TaxID=316 RepID=UPI000C9C79F0|nr:hypothetical protein [Stutzerimonas stutzeri]PNG14366.1 hypothetical protein CXK97_08850 [Stutzerimonas stutzeri]
MRRQPVGLTEDSAMAYLGQTVLMELDMAEDPTFWWLAHIIGIVLAKDGVWDYPYFLVLSHSSEGSTPLEVPFDDILAIRVMRHRDRHGSGNVLGSIALPKHARSRAALPARRDSFTVPSNGSTGAAHP